MGILETTWLLALDGNTWKHIIVSIRWEYLKPHDWLLALDGNTWNSTTVPIIFIRYLYSFVQKNF